MAKILAVKLNGVICNYHRISVQPVPQAACNVTIIHQAWVDKASRQAGDNPVYNSIFIPTRVVPTEDALGNTIENTEVINFYKQKLPSVVIPNETRLDDAMAKIAYSLVTSHYQLLKDASDDL